MPNPFSKSQKVFSVISPVYERAWETFPKFFHALSEQDYKHFEVIVVFDGKNVRGERELKKQIILYPKMKVQSITIEHGGAPAARNAGARIAKGDYYTFLDPDIYVLSETFRQWANAFEEHPDKDVVWGLYSFIQGEKAYTIPDAVPKRPNGQADYWAFRYSNFCSGAFPMRKEAFLGWDESVISLQDWDMWQRMLLLDEFEGSKFLYINKAFFLTEQVRDGGISHDSYTNWKERRNYVMQKNGIAQSKLCVTSLGAPWHGLHVAKKLGAEYLPMPSFKEHDYESIYLLGFYPGPGGPTKTHLQVFAEPGRIRHDERGLPDVQEYFKGNKIIHWIGTDVLKMRTEVPWVTIKYFQDLFKKEGIVQLSEAQHTHDELKEIGLDTKIVPIPPDTLFEIIPLPEEFSVAIYENSTQDLYYGELMERVATSMPDVKFYFFGDDAKKGTTTRNTEHLGWINLAEWMPKFSCNVRVTIHDGLPLTPLQFMTAGRQFIGNVAIFHAHVVTADRKDIIEKIRSIRASNILALEAASHWKKELDFANFTRVITDICSPKKLS